MNSELSLNYPNIARETGFKLRQFKEGSIDWSLIESVNLERILSDQQFENIDSVILRLSESPLSALLDSHVLDSGVAKYFVLLQLALQYLIFCRKFLDESVLNLRENNAKLESQNQQLRKLKEDNASHIVKLHKKISEVEAIHEVVFPCHHCTKNFVSNDALNIHLSKKHFKIPSSENHVRENDQTLISTIKLELEIKQLKERLNNTEKEILETNQIKRSSSREITKSTACTQIEIHTRSIGTQSELSEHHKGSGNNIGTQCNLFEHKEIDCAEVEKVETIQPSSVDFMLSIQEKISKLEALQQTYGSGNQLSIDEIKLRLDEITKYLDVQRTERSEKMSENDTVRVPETILPQKDHKTQEKHHKTPSFQQKDHKTPSFQQKDHKTPSFQQSDLTNMDSEKCKNISNEVKLPSVDLSDETYSVHKSKQTVNSSDIQSNSYKEPKSIKRRNSNNIALNKIANIPKSSEALKKLKSKMISLGLDANCETLSLRQTSQILAHLSEDHNAENKANLSFCTTRRNLQKLLASLTPVSHVNRSKSKENKEKPTNILQEKQNIDKVLRSPIQKPMKQSYSNTEIPRKRVMFHTSMEGSFGTINKPIKYAT